MKHLWALVALSLVAAAPGMAAGVVAAKVSAPLIANRRYLACRLVLAHALTPVCAGCSEPVSVMVTAVHTDGVILSDPITANIALWQQSVPTATRTATWSALKRLYR